MIAKHSIFFLSLIRSINGMHTSAFATTLLLNHAQKEKQCTSKPIQRTPLFIQAEQHEENFIKNLTECSQYNNCNTHKNYQEARYNVLCSIQQLITHRQNLEQNTNGICHACEKTETKNIKKRLTELLMNNR